MTPPDLVRHPLGFWKVEPAPDPEALAAHYRDRYYGARDGRSQYAFGYSERELAHKRIAPEETLSQWAGAPGALLDVGCGEGFTLAAFAEAGWAVEGVDLTLDGVAEFHPALLDRVRAEDGSAALARAAAEGRRYDYVVCSNLLEHVPDPLALLDALKAVSAPGGLLRISAPNDDSWLQRLAVALGRAPDWFWYAAPEHLSYFDAEGLRRVLETCGFEVVDVLAEFPVDLYLLNAESAFVGNRDKGRAAHFARVEFELGLRERGLDALKAFRRACAAAGIGRNLAAYVRVV